MLSEGVVELAPTFDAVGDLLLDLFCFAAGVQIFDDVISSVSAVHQAVWVLGWDQGTTQRMSLESRSC